MADWYFRSGWADPFRDLQRMQDEISRTLAGFAGPRNREFPPMNLWAGEDGVVVTAQVPGVDVDSIRITVHRNTLTVSGGRPADTEECAEPIRRERPTGPFSRTVALPFVVDADQVTARSDAGILHITLPRPEADRPRRIQIATA